MISPIVNVVRGFSLLKRFESKKVEVKNGHRYTRRVNLLRIRKYFLGKRLFMAPPLCKCGLDSIKKTFRNHGLIAVLNCAEVLRYHQACIVGVLKDIFDIKRLEVPVV